MSEIQAEVDSENTEKINQSNDDPEQTEKSSQSEVDPVTYEARTQIQPNFWLDSNYKKVTKRIEDGARTLEELSRLIQERAEIENVYAAKMKAWQRKWLESIYRSNEYGSLLSGVQRVLQEGEFLCDLHQSIRGKLMELSTEIQQWKVQRYPKSLTKYKELRRSDEAFSKAQGPWLVKCKEVAKCMKSYHSAHQTFDGLNNHLVELQSDKQETTQDQINKISSKIKRAELEVENWKNRYDDAIRDVTTYNPKYIDDMNHEFNNCQNFEKTRRDFMKEKLEQFISYVDRRIFLENYEKIYSEICAAHSDINVDQDLESFYKMYGPDHLFETLEFIEYDPSQFESNNQADESKAAPESSTKSSGVCTTL